MQSFIILMRNFAFLDKFRQKRKREENRFSTQIEHADIKYKYTFEEKRNCFSNNQKMFSKCLIQNGKITTAKSSLVMVSAAREQDLKKHTHKTTI